MIEDKSLQIILKSRKANDIVNKIFQDYDRNNSFTISKLQFPHVIRELFKILGGQFPTNQDLDDLFNLLDINGDQNISKYQMSSLIEKLLLIIQQIDIHTETYETLETQF